MLVGACLCCCCCCCCCCFELEVDVDVDVDVDVGDLDCLGVLPLRRGADDEVEAIERCPKI